MCYPPAREPFIQHVQIVRIFVKSPKHIPTMLMQPLLATPLRERSVGIGVRTFSQQGTGERAARHTYDLISSERGSRRTASLPISALWLRFSRLFPVTRR